MYCVKYIDNKYNNNANNNFELVIDLMNGKVLAIYFLSWNIPSNIHNCIQIKLFFKKFFSTSLNENKLVRTINIQKE